MNSCVRRTLVAVWLLVGLGVTGWADTTASHFKVKGETAMASFDASDLQDPCLQYTVLVFAGDQMEKLSPDGGPATELRTILTVGHQDLCRGFVFVSGSGETSQAAFQAPGSLKSATLRATVPVFDRITGEVIDFDVNLTWTATGEPVAHHDKVIFRDDELGVLVIVDSRGKIAPAVASGTVMGLGLNFTREPSVSAEILTQNEGLLTIEQTP